MCCEYLSKVEPVRNVLAYVFTPLPVAPLALNDQPPLKVNLNAAFVSIGFFALNLQDADTPPNIGYIAFILSYKPLL
jgi:hypothetical protein